VRLLASHLEALTLIVWELREIASNPAYNLARAWASLVLETGEIDDEFAAYLIECYERKQA